ADEVDAESSDIDQETPDVPRTRRNRREEARLVKYVEAALEDLYGDSEGVPEGANVAFDVHGERRGGEYENVDVIAIDWRSESIAELVAVEVKLEFSARAVQQANNYRRFADRTWIATVVSGRLENAALTLASQDRRLFDYVVEQGIGILACRRGRGGSYEVVPVQWPRRNRVHRLEWAEFIERYRDYFEEAQVVGPRRENGYPVTDTWR